MDRRNFLKITAAAAASRRHRRHARPCCAPRPEGPIKIGLLAPLTGVVAAGGKEMVEASSCLGQEEQEGRRPQGRDRRRGRRLQPRHRAAEGAPPGRAGQCALPDRQPARQHRPRGRQLREGQRHAVLHPDHRRRRPDAAPRIPNVIRVAGYTASQITRPLGRLGAEAGLQEDRHGRAGLHLRPRAVRRLRPGLHRGAAARSCSSSGTRSTPPTSAPISASSPSSKVDAIFAMETGADSTRFIQQYAELRPERRRSRCIGGDERDRPVGDPHASARRARASSRRRISPRASDKRSRRNSSKDYEAQYGKLPSLYGFSMYSGGMWLDRRR